MSTSVRLGEAGSPIVLVARKRDGSLENLATATKLELRVVSPTAVRTVKSCSLVTDGSDAQFSYTPDAAFWNELGEWTLQGYFEKPGGKVQPLAPFKVQVLPNI